MEDHDAAAFDQGGDRRLRSEASLMTRLSSQPYPVSHIVGAERLILFQLPFFGTPGSPSTFVAAVESSIYRI